MFVLRRPRSPVAALRRAAAVLLALVALVLSLRPAPPAGGDLGTTSRVVVAATDLAPGTALRSGDLRTARFPAGLVPARAARDPTDLAGRVLATAVRAGEPLTDVRLVGSGLTRLLPAGQVAAAVRPADLAVTGLVRPGDRVDVLAAGSRAATEPTEGGGAAAGEGGGTAEPVAEAALVLAVPAATASGPDAGTGPAGLLLLAVDRGTAARLAAASAEETLTVTLTRQ